MRLSFIVLIFAACGFPPLQAQHVHGVGHSRYADERRSHIPSITMEEFEQIRSGEGMGLAKPAELNHYPGPKHVLELADSLGLTDTQRTQIEAIRGNMADQAVALGQEYLLAEHELNQLFANGNADENSVVEMTKKVEEKRSALRAAHLVAHVRTRNALTQEQADEYDRLRGYINN